MTIMDASFVSGTDLGKVIHHLQRVIEIQRILVSQITVLETMTPIDFMDFR
jgi:tryptophan 2,3-dioxygenase